MIGLVDKQKIIISHYREGKTQRQIHRETTIARKTIRRYIREYEEKKNILVNEESSIITPKNWTENEVRYSYSKGVIYSYEKHNKKKLQSSF